MAYFAKVDLENALGANTVKALFDDDLDGIADAAPIAANAENASSEVDAVLSGTYNVALPIANPPAVLKYAALDFGIALAMRRRPDVAEAMNAKSWTEHRQAALEKIKMFAGAMMRLPPSVAVPVNVGGATYDDANRIITNDPDGSSNSGDF